MIRRLVSALAAFSLAASVFASSDTSGLPAIRFRSGPATLTAFAADKERAAAVAPLAGRHALAQFAGPVSNEDRAALAAAGLSLLNPLDGYAFFVAIDANANAAAIGGVSSLKALAPIQQAWKLHPDLAAGNPPIHTIASGSVSQKGDTRIVALNVMFHADSKMGLNSARLVAANKGRLVGEVQSLPIMIVEMPFANLAALAADDSVMWVEPPYPAWSENDVIGCSVAAANAAAACVTANDSNRARVGADTLQAAPYSLDGAGIRPFVFDAGSARTTHQTFSTNGAAPQRVTVIDGSAVASHSTHCAGTIGGNGGGEAGNVHKGMAPMAQILSGALNTSAGSGSVFLYDNLNDTEQDYTTAFSAPNNADLSSNSIGTNTETNGFACSIQGDYGATDALIDTMVRGSLGRPIRAIWANGNERQGTRCNVEGFGSYYSTAPPATAKNHITIGALNSNDDTMTTFSSWGPTDDGRLKPDVSAPGCQSNGDNGVTSSTSTSDTSYGSSCGTSMACPTTAGVSVLLMQHYRRTFPGSPDPRNSTLKTWLAHTAVDLGNPGPDYQFGYGSIRGVAAADLVASGQFLETTVAQGATVSRNITVAGGSPLKVTLAWDDPAGTPNTTGAAALVNDLDLRLIAPDNSVFYPWTLDPLNPSANAVRTGPNRRDNIEQVVVDNPMPGTWRVEVVGFNVASGGPQPFSLSGVPGGIIGMSITPVAAAPTLLAPGASFNFDVDILAVNQTLVPGSTQAFFRSGSSGPFSSAALTLVSGNRYRASLGPVSCPGPFQFYIQAAGSSTGVNTLPSSSNYSVAIGVTEVAFSDNFQTDQGWTVVNTPISGGAFAGAWERGVPITPASTGAPSADADGSGQCYVTGNAASTDIDFGFTAVTSPVINAPGGPLTIAYSRWFHRTSTTAGGDIFVAEYSLDNGANWLNLETVGATTGTITGAWQARTFSIPNGSAQLRLRFTANDNATNSTAVEAGLDAVSVSKTTCVNPPSCPADWDHNGQIEPADIASFVNAWLGSLSGGGLAGDFDNSGTVDPADIASFVNAWLDALSTGC